MTRKKHTFGLRLRTRGGAAVQKRWTRIMNQMNLKHKCPSCASPSVLREAAGIWNCSKCGFRFAGGAYVPATKSGQSATRAQSQ